MPGFHDSHVHVIFSGLYEICVNLKNTKSEEEAAKLVGEFAENPKYSLGLGFSWFPGFWESGENAYTRFFRSIYFRQTGFVKL